MSTTRRASSAAEHATLRAFCARVAPVAKNAVGAVAKAADITAAPWVGRVYAGPSGDEVVVIITVTVDPTMERGLIEAEKKAAKLVREHLIAAGFNVGGVITTDHRQVWVRGPVVPATVAA